MSLWRVKHTLSPIFEAALVTVVAAYGFLAIYLASLAPMTDTSSAYAAALPQPVPLDLGLWARVDDPVHGFAFAAPPGWVVDPADPANVRLGRSGKEAASAPFSGGGMAIGIETLQPRQEIANLAAAEFAGTRPALYDVAVDGQPALFVVAFENGHVLRQAVYVAASSTAAVVLRAASADPAAFSLFVSSLTFYRS